MILDLVSEAMYKFSQKPTQCNAHAEAENLQGAKG
jgi:hypothetical protein